MMSDGQKRSDDLKVCVRFRDTLSLLSLICHEEKSTLWVKMIERGSQLWRVELQVPY